MTNKETPRAKGTKVSERIVLDESGDSQDSYLDAGGFCYHSLVDDYKAEVLFSELPQSVVNGLAAFGALTLAGNTTNTVRNGKNSRWTTEKDALDAWVADLRAGNWTSESGEVEAGAKLLAEAVARVKSQHDGQTRGEDAIAKIEAWLLAHDVADDQRKATSKKRRADANARTDVKAARLDIQRERLAASAAQAAGPLEIPG